MLQTKQKLAPRFKDLQSPVAHYVIQRGSIFQIYTTIYGSKISSVTPLSEKPAYIVWS